MACWFLAKNLTFYDPPSLKFHYRTDTNLNQSWIINVKSSINSYPLAYFDNSVLSDCWMYCVDVGLLLCCFVVPNYNTWLKEREIDVVCRWFWHNAKITLNIHYIYLSSPFYIVFFPFLSLQCFLHLETFEYAYF